MEIPRLVVIISEPWRGIAPILKNALQASITRRHLRELGFISGVRGKEVAVHCRPGRVGYWELGNMHRSCHSFGGKGFSNLTSGTRGSTTLAAMRVRA